jgi:hypothetical protein
MLFSQERFVERLSKLQRELLIEHVRDHVRPFSHDRDEAATRAGLISRGLIRWEPDTRSRIGVPDGTVLTELGREAVCLVLGWYIDALVVATERKEVRFNFPQERQAALFNLLAESVPYWRREAVFQTMQDRDQ